MRASTAKISRFYICVCALASNTFEFCPLTSFSFLSDIVNVIRAVPPPHTPFFKQSRLQVKSEPTY